MKFEEVGVGVEVGRGGISGVWCDVGVGIGGGGWGEWG